MPVASTLELLEAPILPRPQRQHKRRAMAKLARTPITLDDLGALPGGIPQRLLEFTQAGFRDLTTMKKELFLRSGEMARREFPQQFLMNVALHRTAGAPAEMPADQQPDAIPRLQFDDLQLVELVEKPHDLTLAEFIGTHDILE